MFLGLEKEYQDFQNIFQPYVENYFLNRIERKKSQKNILWESMRYSFQSGGKQFRPFLCYLVANAYKVDFHTTIRLALAVECIHTYSLIHDDLPALDNDDLRRGLPTNHKRYGEDIAILAGDALQAEAFHSLSEINFNSVEQAKTIFNLFSDLIGMGGMVAGQALDMKLDQEVTLDQLESIHNMKTGALIQLSVICSAILCKADEKQITQLKKYSQNLGLAFQIKDDILDGLDSDQNFKSYLKLLGSEKTLIILNEVSAKATGALSQILDLKTEGLVKLVEFNLRRAK